MQFSEIVTGGTSCKFSPNSEYFVYQENKKIFIKESSVNLNNFSIIPIGTTPSDIIISPDSELIAVLFKEKSLVLVYNTKGSTVAKIQDTKAGIYGIVWSPDSYQLLVFSQLLYKCSIYNLNDKSINYIRSPKLGTSKGCIFSSNGKLMALLEKHDCKDTLGIYFCGDWKMVNSIQLESFDIIEIVWAPNDSHIVAWENPIDYKLYAICPYKGVVFRYQPYDYALGIKTVEYSNRTLFLAIGSFDEKIRLLNALTWKLISQLDCSSPVINSENTKIYKQEDNLKGLNNKMKLVDRNQYKIPTTKPVISDKSAPTQGIGLLEFSHDDCYLACRNDNMPFTVWIWNISSLEVESIISLNSNVKSLKWDKFENNLCIASGTEKVLFWKNGVILQCALSLQNRKFNIHKFSWSNDCKRMILFDKAEFLYADLINND